MVRSLIRDGCVLSMDPKVGNHRRADVLVDDGLIAEVGPGLRARDAEVVDATDSIVMPGFVDTHRHLRESLFRGLGDGFDPGPRFGRHYSEEDVYAATLIGLLGSAGAGITTVADWVDVPPQQADAVLRAYVEAGVRTVFVHAGSPAEDGVKWRTSLESSAGSSSPPLSSMAAASPVSLDDIHRLSEDWNVARGAGFRLHAHTGAAGQVAKLGERGLLGPDVTMVHGSRLEEADFDAIAAAGASVCLAPSSEMAHGRPPPPMQMLIDREIRPGLAVGTERVAPGDMFAPMRAAISLQHATHFDQKLAGKGGLPGLLTTREVIRYATIDGARAVGLGDVTGSLTPGKQADVLVLRADRPNISPVSDPIGAVVWGMDTSNLHWVFVAGRALMRDGEPTADVAGARDLAVRARRRVVEMAGLMAGTGEPG